MPSLALFLMPPFSFTSQLPNLYFNIYSLFFSLFFSILAANYGQIVDLEMEITELCLAPRKYYGVDQRRGSSSESETKFSGKKRKFFNENPIQTSVDLHVRHPLPSDWEQCLDLESGEMYYLNRKTSRKSWKWPNNKEQKVDLELNISVPICEDQQENLNERKEVSTNMVALACSNCHLLVILSRSSPSCPNCKYVHSLPLFTHQPLFPKFSPHSKSPLH